MANVFVQIFESIPSLLTLKTTLPFSLTSIPWASIRLRTRCVLPDSHERTAALKLFQDGTRTSSTHGKSTPGKSNDFSGGMIAQLDQEKDEEVEGGGENFLTIARDYITKSFV